MAADLQEIIAPRTQAEYETEVNARLDENEVPRSSWLSLVNVGLSLVKILTELFAELRAAVAVLASAMFLEYAAGRGLTLFAKSQYQIERSPPVNTEGYILLYSVGGAPVYNFTAGQVIVGQTGSTGQRYDSTAAATLNSASRVLVPFIAEEGGAAGNLPPGSSVELKTSYAGVSARLIPVLVVPGADANGGVIWGTLVGTVAVAHVISGNNTPLTVTRTAGSPEVITVNVATDAMGNPTSTAAQVVAAYYTQVVDLGGNVETLHRQYTGDGSGIVGEMAQTTLTTWITTQGQDEESEARLAERCGDKWSTLGVGGNEEAMRFWALAIPTDYTASPVQRCTIRSNFYEGAIAGGAVTVLIAGASGALPAADVTAVEGNFEGATEDYPDADYKKYPIGCLVDVVTTTNNSVSVTGTVYILRSAGLTAEEVQTLVEDALTDYQEGLDIGATLYRQDIEAAITAAAETAIRNVVLTAPASYAAISQMYNQTAVFSLSLTYTLVD